MGFLKDKLYKIRESDETTKKHWLITLSAVSMVVIVALWLFYMNSFVVKDINDQTQETVSMNTGFWPIFKTGLKVTSENIGGKIKNLLNSASNKIPLIGKSTITIENPQ